MALKLSTEFKGVLAEYWRINEVREIVKENKTIVFLSLYVDEASRRANVFNELLCEAFTFTELDLTREQVYLKIKESNIVDGVETNKFANAVDC